MVYTLTVRDSMMIAHSFQGAQFGPAQQLHGATYTVDCEFRTPTLVEGYNWVIDIGQASDVLKDVLAKYNYKCLDEIPELRGHNTTTEFMCKQIFDGIAQRLKGTFTGEIRVQLSESHIAWASYTETV